MNETRHTHQRSIGRLLRTAAYRTIELAEKVVHRCDRALDGLARRRRQRRQSAETDVKPDTPPRPAA